ncbi:heterogeneous nuclear ribonucleoprotein A1-like 2 [Saccoglossus kowalevskii]
MVGGLTDVDVRLALSGCAKKRTRGKVFLGGTQGLVENDLETELHKIGKTKLLRIMKNPNGKPKGFGFVTFDDEMAADKLIVDGHILVKGKMVYALPAIDKSHLTTASVGSTKNHKQWIPVAHCPSHL